MGLSRREEPSLAAGDADAYLLSRLRRGDLEALGLLYERHKMEVFRTALAITRDQGAAEDILQECFLRLYANASRIWANRPLGPWLYRVTVNLSYDWYQDRQRWVGPLETMVERLISPLHALPEPLAERTEVQEQVQKALERLPFSHRVVVVLFYLEGLSLKEIAEILEVPEGTVKSRLHYARESLREMLTEWRPVARVACEFT